MVDYPVFMTKCGFNSNSCKKMSEIYMSIAIRESLILHHHYLFFGFHKHITRDGVVTFLNHPLDQSPDKISTRLSAFSGACSEIGTDSWVMHIVQRGGGG